MTREIKFRGKNGKAMKVYISGPVTGLPLEEAERAFNEAETTILKKGHEPVNPLKNGLPGSATWHEHMRVDIKMLLDCQAIFMLEGWEQSDGARLEWMIAFRLGFKFFNFMS